MTACLRTRPQLPHYALIETQRVDLPGDFIEIVRQRI
jgi:hypothetical protein